MVGSDAGLYFQICLPVTASIAKTPFGALKYMTLSTTIGGLANRPDPVWKVHARLRLCDVRRVDLLQCGIAGAALIGVRKRPVPARFIGLLRARTDEGYRHRGGDN